MVWSPRRAAGKPPTSTVMLPMASPLGAGETHGTLPGMALAIEPMLAAGSDKTEELGDGWTVVTVDGCRAAHWEHSVAVTVDGPLILTVE